MPVWISIASVEGFSEVINVVFSIFGFGAVALIFFLGGIITTYVKIFLEVITENLHFHLSPAFVDVLLKTLVIAAALIISAPAFPAFHDVISTMVPFGDFNEISGAFANREGRFLINIIFNVILEQISLSLACFIPFILVNMIISFIELFLCERDWEGGMIQAGILFLVDIIMLYVVNAFMLNHGNVFGVMMLEFLRSIRLSAGLLPFLLMLILFVVMFFYAVRDVLTSDVLVPILTVNIVAAVMNFAVTDGNRLWVLLLALAFGLASKLIRRFFADIDYFMFDAMFAFFSMVITGVISAVIFAIAR